MLVLLLVILTRFYLQLETVRSSMCCFIKCFLYLISLRLHFYCFYAVDPYEVDMSTKSNHTYSHIFNLLSIGIASGSNFGSSKLIYDAFVFFYVHHQPILSMYIKCLQVRMNSSVFNMNLDRMVGITWCSSLEWMTF